MASIVPQSYATHRKFVPGFHYTLFGLILVFLGWSIWDLIARPSLDAAMDVVLALVLGGLFYYVRMFPLRAQDRLIRLEERLRMERLLPEELKGRLGDLTVRQCVALRFASDGELEERVREALDEGLGGEAIKKRVVTWRPDHDRL